MTAEPVTAGVDVGGTKVLAVAIDPTEPSSVSDAIRTATPGGLDPLVDVLVDTVSALDRQRSPGRLAAIGIGLPGLVTRSGTFQFGPHLPGVVGVDLGAALEERLGVPTTVVNDAAAATWAEFCWGAAEDAQDAIVLTFGTGVGGGLVVDGRLVDGANGFAGEPGHQVVDPDGPLCGCGRRGCWEQLASGSALARQARRAVDDGLAPTLVELVGGDRDAVRGEHVVELARAGDTGALAVLDGYARWVAIGLVNLVSILDPEVVVLGGGVMSAGRVLLDAVETAYEAEAGAIVGDRRVQIRLAATGERAGAIGCALLAAEAARTRHDT